MRYDSETALSAASAGVKAALNLQSNSQPFSLAMEICSCPISFKWDLAGSQICQQSNLQIWLLFWRAYPVIKNMEMALCAVVLHGCSMKLGYFWIGHTCYYMHLIHRDLGWIQKGPAWVQFMHHCSEQVRWLCIFQAGTMPKFLGCGGKKQLYFSSLLAIWNLHKRSVLRSVRQDWILRFIVHIGIVCLHDYPSTFLRPYRLLVWFLIFPHLITDFVFSIGLIADLFYTFFRGSDIQFL